MTSKFKICVYCGSQPGALPDYMQAAKEMGALCAQEKWRLVYGGGRVGLMGAVADSALAHGAEVTGIIPQDLHTREVAHTGLTELHVTKSMHERQMMMARMADAFVVLPGGLGTLAEFFEIVTWRQLRFHNKPIIVVNIREYWNKLLDAVDYVEKEKFLHGRTADLYHLTPRISDIAEIIRNLPPEPGPVKTEKM